MRRVAPAYPSEDVDLSFGIVSGASPAATREGGAYKERVGIYKNEIARECEAVAEATIH